MIIKWITDNLKMAIGIALLVGIALFIGINSCKDNGKEAAQARQDTKSAEAYAASAKVAVETVTENANKNASVDAIVAAATLEIDNAENPVAARAAVISAVCGLSAYSKRPECQVRADGAK